MDNNISKNLKKNNNSKPISNNYVSDSDISNNIGTRTYNDNDLSNNNDNKNINSDIEDYYNDKKKKLSGLFNNARLKIHKFKRLDEFDDE